uniref:Uncharacterized protein n=1 Tax=Monopterus albus TaxID=43700 RepID=A0A3Q3IMQ6_MONAL
MDPNAVDGIHTKRRDLIYRISNTEDLLDLLVTERVMPAAKRYIILTHKDHNSRTALHWAASSQGESRVVDFLLSAKVNSNTTDNEKKTALHLAGEAKDMDRSTPLQYAAAGRHASVVSALLQSLNNKGIEEWNAWRKSPLHATPEKGHDSVVVLLLEAGAKINTTYHSKDTPLHCAACSGHHEIVKRLVNWGQAGHMGWKKKANLVIVYGILLSRVMRGY